MEHHLDLAVIGFAHLGTALAYYAIGAVLVYVAVTLWNEHPVNRVLRLGPYVTEDGLRALLTMWPLTFLFGAFILSCAIDHTLDFFQHLGMVSTTALRVSAMAESVISIGTAFFVIAAVARHWWHTR